MSSGETRKSSRILNECETQLEGVIDSFFDYWLPVLVHEVRYSHHRMAGKSHQARPGLNGLAPEAGPMFVAAFKLVNHLKFANEQYLIQHDSTTITKG